MTVYQTDLRPAFVEPIPVPRLQVQRLMLATSLLVDGCVDIDPGRFQPYLTNTYLMSQAHLVLGGTMCRRPLIMREFADVCRAAQLDGILVRLLGEQTSSATFDIKLAGDDRMLCVYVLWMPRLAGPAWLIPSAGYAPFLRLDPIGIEIVDEPPFDCERERERGLVHAAEFLSVVAQGWF